MPRSYSPDIVAKARQRYLEGKSLQAIADELLPQAKHGRMTILRWKERDDWDVARQELDAQKKQQFEDDFASVAVRLAKDHLALASKVRRAIDLTLDQYFVVDPLSGEVSIRLHPKSGLPIIPALALASLIEKATDLERRALGMESVIPQESLERVAGRPATEVVEVDADLLKRYGDFLAIEAGGKDGVEGLHPLDGETHAVSGPATLAVPEGDHPVGSTDDVDVTLEPGSGVIDAVDLPAGQVDVYTQPALFGGEFSGPVNAPGTTGDHDVANL